MIQKKGTQATVSLGRCYEVIRYPVISEKAMNLGEVNKVVFKVPVDSTKPEIKFAVEKVFSVDVVKVNTVIVKGKVKRFRGHIGQRPDYKKAYVTLKSGQELDLSLVGL